MNMDFNLERFVFERVLNEGESSHTVPHIRVL